MGATKRRIIDGIIQTEGGYVDRPDDSGGPTNYGITKATARAYGYQGDMRDLPRAVAFEIYAARYWDAVGADNMPDAIAEEVVDTAVNMGQRRAVEFLQRSLNVLNDKGRLYDDLSVDGVSGPKTMEALRAYRLHRSQGALLKALNCLQGAAYIELAERREKDEAFVYGWLRHRVEL